MRKFYHALVAGLVGLCSWSPSAQSREIPAQAQPPLVEVVAFAVAPVSASPADAVMQPRLGDHVYTARARPLSATPDEPQRPRPTQLRRATLFTAADTIGFPEAIALQLAEIFADQVDFHRELDLGYRSSLAYEVYYEHGHIARAGRILAAELEIDSRKLSAFYFDDGTGQGGYYSEDGTSLSRTFRKSPIEFSRVTSRVTSQYSLARLHPILGVWRAHRGVDYAAPLGTHVLAAADGVFDFIGERGAYGKLVVLQHPGGYFTYYAHLDAYASDAAIGGHVRKGQVIGTVGMTGLATAPHLHFEFRVADSSGERISVAPPEDSSVAPGLATALSDVAVIAERRQISSEAFFESVLRYRAQLRVARETHFVMLD